MNAFEALVYTIFLHLIQQNDDYRAALNQTFELGKLLSGYLDEESDKLKQLKLQAIKKYLQALKVLDEDEVNKYIDNFMTGDDESSYITSEDSDEEGDAPLLSKILKECAECECQPFDVSTTEKLLALFGVAESTITSQMNVLNYLTQYVNANEEARIPVHDACLFNVPSTEWTPAIWSKLVLRYVRDRDNLKSILQLIVSATQIEKNYQQSGTKVSLLKHSPAELKSYLNSYENKGRHPEAAKLFFSLGMNERDFDEYLKLKPVDDTKLIPNIKITHGKFTLSFLSASDPRAAVLGHLTGCCQSIGGIGEDCVRYGIEHPAGGFYIMTNPKGKIVSQFFAWRAGNHFCIDSLESCVEIFSAEDNKGEDVRLVEAFANALVKGDYGIESVHIGTSGRTPGDFGGHPLVDQETFQPVDYPAGNYRDSKCVRAIAVSMSALLKQLGVTDDTNWLEQALKNITHIEQLLYLTEGINERNKHMFKCAYERTLYTFGNTNVNKWHMGNLILAAGALTEHQFSLVCDALQCNRFTSDDFQEIDERLGHPNRRIFAAKYFDIEGAIEWWKSFPWRIKNLSELVGFVLMCENAEQLKGVKPLLTGKQAITGVAAESSVLVQVMRKIDRDKCESLYFLCMDEIKSYSQLVELAPLLSSIPRVESDIRTNFADKFDESKDKFITLLPAVDGKSKFLQKMLLEKLDYQRGGLDSVKDYRDLLNVAKTDQTRDAIIDNMILHFDELVFTNEEGFRLKDIFGANISYGQKQKLLARANEVVHRDSAENFHFIFEQYFPAVSRSERQMVIEVIMVRMNANLAAYIQHPTDFQLVWDCNSTLTITRELMHEFINGIISQKILHPAELTDKPDVLAYMTYFLEPENLEYALTAIYAKTPDILYNILKNSQKWFCDENAAMKILVNLFKDKIDFGDGMLLKQGGDLLKFLPNLSLDDAHTVIDKIKDRLPIDEDYLLLFRELKQETRDLVYVKIATSVVDENVRTKMVNSFPKLTCLITQYPDARGNDLFNLFVKGDGLSPDGRVIKSFVEPVGIDEEILVPFSHAQRDVIFEAVLRYVQSDYTSQHMFTMLPRVAQLFTPVQSRALLQAAPITKAMIADYEERLFFSEYDPIELQTYLDICLGRQTFAEVFTELKHAFKKVSKDERVQYLNLLLQHPMVNNAEDEKVVLDKIHQLEASLAHKQAIEALKESAPQEAAWVESISAREYCDKLGKAKQKWQQLQQKNARIKFNLFKRSDADLKKKLDKESRVLLDSEQASKYNALSFEI